MCPVSGGAKLRAGFRRDQNHIMITSLAVHESITASISERSWYAAYTNPNHEKRVAKRLEARSVQYFLPLYKSTSVWKDRRVLIHRPLFPGYIFVCLPVRSGFGALQVPGVVRLVGFGERPSEIAGPEFDTLRAGVSSGVDIRPHPRVKVGARVRVCEGPFAGLRGTLLCERNSHRLVLTIPVIERSAVVEVDADSIEYDY
jgi:transcription antitermination factor NusG